jgi:hypothetical protein
VLLVLFFQDDYAQKAGIAPAPLSISDELKEEVSNYSLASKNTRGDNVCVCACVLLYSSVGGCVGGWVRVALLKCILQKSFY